MLRQRTRWIALACASVGVSAFGLAPSAEAHQRAGRATTFCDGTTASGRAGRYGFVAVPLRDRLPLRTLIKVTYPKKGINGPLDRRRRYFRVMDYGGMPNADLDVWISNCNSNFTFEYVKWRVWKYPWQQGK